MSRFCKYFRRCSARCWSGIASFLIRSSISDLQLLGNLHSLLNSSLSRKFWIPSQYRLSFWHSFTRYRSALSCASDSCWVTSAWRVCEEIAGTAHQTQTLATLELLIAPVLLLPSKNTRNMRPAVSHSPTCFFPLKLTVTDDRLAIPVRIN